MTFISSSNFSSSTHFYISLYYDILSSSAANNQTSVRTSLYVTSRDGYSGSGSALSCVINGSSFSGSTSIGINSSVLQGYRDATYTHDANGYLTVSLSGSCSSAWGIGSASTSGSVALPRLPLAPIWASSTADNITTNSVRLGNEISSFGHGTSCNMRMYYRKSGDSSWSQTADQADASGYNYWTVTGLSSGKTYEYFSRQWNNNGDSADGSVQSFTTKSGVKVILSNGTVEDRTIKSISPSGVVTTCIATKVV